MPKSEVSTSAIFGSAKVLFANLTRKGISTYTTSSQEILFASLTKSEISTYQNFFVSHNILCKSD